MRMSPKMAANPNSNHLPFPYLHSTSTSTASTQAAAPLTPYAHPYAHAHAHQVVHSFDYLYQHFNHLPLSLSHHHQAPISPAPTHQAQNQPQSHQFESLKSSLNGNPHEPNNALGFFGPSPFHSNQILHQSPSLFQATHYSLPHAEQQQHQPEALQQQPEQQQQYQQPGKQLPELLQTKSNSPSPTTTARPSLTPPERSLAITAGVPLPAAAPTASSSKPHTGPSEFVKKLYKMLDEPSSNSIVSWGASKTTVVVKDQAKFQTEVLPKHFKHSNFASFVRQLNKYDFRKVKLLPDGDQQQPNQQLDGKATAGSSRWEFYHPHFRADTLAELDHIKRKPPASRPRVSDASSAGPSDGLGAVEATEDVRRLAAQQEDTATALGTLADECRALKAELAQARRCLESQQRQIDLLRRPSRPLAGYLPPGWPLSAGTLEGAPQNSYGWTVPPRVLVVEDDQVCRRISTTILELVGCRIETAADGLKAVSRMRDGNCAPVDLVLMDILMPNMDGLLATSLIRKFDLMTPIISMTSNSAPVDVVRYIDIGMNDCLPKPFTKEGLLVMLKKHLFNPIQKLKFETDYPTITLHQEPLQHQPGASALLEDQVSRAGAAQTKRKANAGDEEEGSARFEVDVSDEGDEATRIGETRNEDEKRQGVCGEWDQRASDGLSCSSGRGEGQDENSSTIVKRRRI